MSGEALHPTGAQPDNQAAARLLIVVPAYNEAATVGDVLDRIADHAPDADVVVVDDGSIDATARVAREHGALVFSHPFNLGAGSAVQTGLKYALVRGYDLVVNLDGDGQHDSADVPRLMERLLTGGADLVVGSRFLYGGTWHKGFTRWLGCRFFGAICSLAMRQRITDPTSGFRAFGGRALALFATDAFPFDYPDADVILTAYRHGLRIEEVPVEITPRRHGRSMHRGWHPFYYVLKMSLAVTAALLRSPSEPKNS